MRTCTPGIRPEAELDADSTAFFTSRAGYDPEAALTSERLDKIRKRCRGGQAYQPVWRGPSITRTVFGWPDAGSGSRKGPAPRCVLTDDKY